MSRDTRERIAPLLEELRREPAGGGMDYYRAFMEYIVKTGPADTLDELMPRMAPELRGDLMTCGEMLRREGELRGRLETIDGFLRAGVGWPVIQSATGIDERTYRTLNATPPHGPDQAAPR